METVWYNVGGVRTKAFSYGAYGVTTETIHFAGTVVDINPFRYRSYYYDIDIGLYCLGTRYYDSVTGRFASPDSYVSTGQGLLGYNMYAYCNNNPVNYYDPSGQLLRKIWSFIKKAATEVGRSLGNMAPAYAIAGSVAVADGPAPVGDTIALVVVVVATTVAVGRGICSAVSISDENTVSKSEEVILPQKKQAYFTVDPYKFNPNGLVRMEYYGSNNGKIIKWKDPITNMDIFEWDEDLKFGSHYHILSNGKHTGDHISPGTPVPEPWNSRYFGG